MLILMDVSFAEYIGSMLHPIGKESSAIPVRERLFLSYPIQFERPPDKFRVHLASCV